MSDFTQALALSGGIAAVVLATQYGYRRLDRRGIIRPLLMVGGVGAYYLRDVPLSQPALWLYAVGIALGLVFGAVASVFTKVVRDADTGHVMTLCGAGFVATWLTALAARLIFVWLADYNDGFRDHLGTWMYQHHLTPEALVPFFLLWALTMVVSRVATTLVRAGHLPRAAAPSPEAVAA